MAGLTACAWQQASYWRNSERLWERALACTTNNAVAHNNLGLALANGGQIERAISHYRAALAIDPGNPQAHNNLALALVGQRRAARRGRRGVSDGPVVRFPLSAGLLQPGDRVGRPRRGRAGHRPISQGPGNQVRLRSRNYLLGKALARSGKLDEAATHYQEVLKTAPTLLPLLVNLGSH